jgi:hypothetical protein
VKGERYYFGSKLKQNGDMLAENAGKVTLNFAMQKVIKFTNANNDIFPDFIELLCWLFSHQGMAFQRGAFYSSVLCL